MSNNQLATHSQLWDAERSLLVAYVGIRQAAEVLDGPNRARADEIASEIEVAVFNVDYLRFRTEQIG